jgi:hypothetical protein
MEANERGTEMNFAIIDETSQSAIGTTSFYRVAPEHKRFELGEAGSERPTDGHISTRQQSICCSITPSKQSWQTESNEIQTRETFDLNTQ